MYLVNAGSYGAGDGARDGDVGSSDLDYDYSSPSSAVSMTVSGDDAVMIYALTANILTVWKFALSIVFMKARTFWSFTLMSASTVEFVSRSVQQMRLSLTQNQTQLNGLSLTENILSSGQISQ